MEHPTFSAYFTSLVKKLVDRMLTRGFQMTLLVNLDTYLNQYAALKDMRDYSSTKYKSLEDEENRLSKNLCSLLKPTNRGSVSFTQGETKD